jgi:hypothetical protein
MSASPFSAGTKILAVGAGVLLLFLAVGVALPGTWSAERSAVLSAPPEAVLPMVDAPMAWRAWTEWPDSGLVAEGPERGAGARLVWNDRELGDGSFEIVEAGALEGVRYRVSVQGGSMHTDGTFLMAPEGGGTRVTWREEGDFGWNPLMGYWARLMERVQGVELEKALIRLDSLTSGVAPPLNGQAPADTGSTGA